jgi:hypothetical protein
LFNTCKPIKNTNIFSGIDVNQLETELNSMQKCSYPKVDTIHGGYYINFGDNWELSEKPEKMLVTQA